MSTSNITNTPLKALIVDDEATNRLVLNKLLIRLNYEIIEAKNGVEAIQKFKETSPDIIFMDVMMPIMNGHEATLEIKKLCSNDFVPVIFLTALSGADELKKCVDAGGDDFLSKPFDMLILRSKIKTMERIRKLYRDLKLLNSQLKEDDQFARNIFSEAIFKKNERINAIKTWFETGERFNNDFLLTSFTPSGGLNVLFGHFDLQGTAAAVGALPTSEVFRAMTLKGFSPHDIVDTINQKLHSLLPSHIYLQAIFLNFNQEVNVLNYANFGMPESYVISGDSSAIVNTIEKSEIYIGNKKQFESKNMFKTISISHRDRIIVGRSNLIENHFSEIQLITTKEYRQIIESTAPDDNFVQLVKSKVFEKLQNITQDKHLSLIEISCAPELTPKNIIDEQISELPNKNGLDKFNSEDALLFEFCIQNEHLKNIDPVPTLLNFLSAVTSIEKQQDTLFTIFTEFYANALDHGVLKLDSSLKATAEGFYNYFIEKENRLKKINTGRVSIKLSVLLNPEQNKLKIEFSDSGQGFDHQKITNEQFTPGNIFSGRGYLLIKHLCDFIEFNTSGNHVTAIYCWKN